MKAAILLSHEKTSYVRIPRSFAQHLWSLQPPTAGSHILQLQWQGADGGVVKSACVGWAGAVGDQDGVVEVPVMLARGIDLEIDLTAFPDLLVDVRLVEDVPVASRIAVEPETPDDWEILELNSNRIELELLRQICVVNPGQRVTVWVQESIKIVLAVDNDLSGKHNLLLPRELIVLAAATDGEGDIREFMPSEPLRTMACRTNSDVKLPSPIAAVLHPSTLLSIPGVREVMGTGPEEGHRLFALVWSEDGTRDFSMLSAQPPHERPLLGVVSVVELVAFPGAYPRHIELPLGTRMQLRLEPLTLVRVRLLDPDQWSQRYELSTQQVKLYPLRTSKNIRKEETRASMIRAKCKVDSLNVPLISGTILNLGSTEDKEDLWVRVALKDGERSDEREAGDEEPTAVEEDTREDAKIPKTPKLFWSLSLAEAELGEEEELELPPIWPPGTGDQRDIRMTPMAECARAVVRDVWMEVAPLLCRSVATSRILLGTPARGCALLCGAAGSGKSFLLRSLCSRLSEPTNSIYCVMLDCRALRGRKMADVKAELTNAMSKAIYHSPSLLVLDDLDALIPAESEEPGAPNEQSWQLAEHLASLLKAHQCSTQRWEEFCRDFAAAQAVGSESAELQELCCTRQVAIVASCKASEDLHEYLQQSGSWDKKIEIGSLKAVDREEMLRALLKSHGAGQRGLDNRSARERLSCSGAEEEEGEKLGEIDLQSIANSTEGYNAGDLNALVQRAWHKAVLRGLRQENEVEVSVRTGADERERENTAFRGVKELNEGRTCIDRVALLGTPLSSLRVTTADLQEAEQGFTPSSLRGVTLFKSSIEWEDVGGLEDVRQTLKDTLELPTKYSRLYERAPIRLPSGVMLYGPPGCGKTLLAAAVAHECGVNFISVKGPEVLNKYIGASEQAVRDLFTKAAGAAPCVLFLDEFDSLAPRRGADHSGVTDRVVNQLLTFLDGVETRSGVYVLAATSRPDMIDPALLRPGRLDKALYVGFPSSRERAQIFQAVARKMKLSKEAKKYLKSFAHSKRSQAFSGADLQALVYSAQLMAVHENLDSHMADRKRSRPPAMTSTLTENMMFLYSGVESSDPVIEIWHLERAAEEARPSVSGADRQRYDTIYEKFRSSRREASFPAADSDMSQTIAHQRTALA